ncbi:MAG: hypothetical protein JWO41_829 [Candidatus Saccharibacteria bacterium]|nr:hypothetical protein [Candidatus Saccharibacteria bacterium]
MTDVNEALSFFPSPEAVDYYQQVLGLQDGQAACLARPQMVYDEVTTQQNLNVYWRPGQAPYTYADSAVNSYLSTFATQVSRVLPLAEDVKPWLGTESTGVHNYGPQPIATAGDLLPSLVDRKIVTGRISYLVIQAVAPSELPDRISHYFQSQSKVTAVTRKPIEGHDSYFILQGKLITGSRLARIACGVAMTPFEHIGKSAHPYSRNAKHRASQEFRVVAKRYTLPEISKLA